MHSQSVISAADIFNPNHAAFGDFLQLTLQFPEQQPEQHFMLANGCAVQIWDTGVIAVLPQNPGPLDLVLSCGVHGNETAPIEILATLCRQILTGQLLVQNRLLLLFSNPPAINAGKRELVDNLNRLFSGHHRLDETADLADPAISWERRRAAKLEQYVSRFYASGAVGQQRALYDLHTAIRGSQFEKFAVYPFLHGKAWSEQQLNLLKACGVNTVLLMQTPASTFSYYASNSHRAAAFTIELGKVRPFGENDMSRFAQCQQVLAQLIENQPLAVEPFDEQQFNLFAVSRSVMKQTELFKLCFPANIENFTQLPLGTLLATDGEMEYKVDEVGEAIIFPNANVAIGQRAMLLVKPISVMGKTK